MLSELRSRIGGDAAKLLPEPQGDFENPELAADVVHVVSRMARCAYGKESFLEEDYLRVLALLDQVRPWLRCAKLFSNVILLNFALRAFQLIDYMQILRLRYPNLTFWC